MEVNYQVVQPKQKHFKPEKLRSHE